jgi:hypothetical protein
MAVTRTIKGTFDKLQVSSGTEITYLGPTKASHTGDLVRGFRVTPASTGDLIVKIDKSSAVIDIKIFQEDSFAGGSAASAGGYLKYFNIAKAGKGKGAVGLNVTDSSKKYIVLLTFDDYSEASYIGSVVVP